MPPPAPSSATRSISVADADGGGVGAPRLHRRVWLLAAGLAWGARLLSGAAAPTEPAVVLPPWVIEASVDRAAPAAREDSFASTLGPTSVVDATTWSGRAIGTLAEALRRTPGVMLQESFGGFEPPRLSVRGSGLDSAPTARGVALLVDGLPLARADGSFHSGLFDPLLFSRVEVYRGTMHMALTPAVLGGVVHAVAATAGASPGVMLRVEGGDFGQTRAQFSATTPHTALAVSQARSRGWREHSQQDRTALAVGARPVLGASAQLELAAYFARADYDVPGPLTAADALQQPRLASAAARRDLPRRDADLARVSAQLKAAPAGTRLAAGVAWLRLRDDFFQLQGNGETDAISDDVTAHVTAARRQTAIGGEHHLLARATFSDGLNRVDRFRNDRAVRGPRFGAYDGRARTAALSLEDILWLRPDLAAGVGLTALHARRAITDRHNPAGNTSVSREFAIRDWSPRMGLTWQARPDLVGRVAISRGVEPPSFDDVVAVQGAYPALGLRSRELRGQRATTIEVGLQGSRGPLGWDVTVYRGEWRGEILRLADAEGLPRGAVNAGATRHQGIESAIRWRLSESLTLTGTSTLGRFVFVGDPVYGRNRIAGAPPHVCAAELLYQPARGAFAALEPTWVSGRTAVDHAGRLTYGGHGLLHARVGWRQARRLTVFLAVRNVFDHRYLASSAGVLDLARAPAGTAIFLPGPGRAFTLGCELRR